MDWFGLIIFRTSHIDAQLVSTSYEERGSLDAMLSIVRAQTTTDQCDENAAPADMGIGSLSLTSPRTSQAIVVSQAIAISEAIVVFRAFLLSLLRVMSPASMLLQAIVVSNATVVCQAM